MKPIAEQFLDWVRRECINAGLNDSEVFDQRDQDLSWLTAKDLESKTGLACIISLPKERRTGNTNAPDATEYRAAVLVVLRTNSLLAADRGNAYKVAHDLFCHFIGRQFWVAEADAPRDSRITGNVVADAFDPDADKKTDFFATFELSITYIIDKENGII